MDVEAAGVLAAQAARYPQFAMSASVTRAQTDDLTSRTLSNTDTYVPASVTGTLPLYHFGRISKQVDLSRKTLESAGYALDLRQAQIVLDVETAYFEALRTELALDITESSLRLRRKYVAIISRAYERGSRSKFDLARAETDLEAARLDQISAAARAETARRRLLTAMGTPDAPWKRLSDPLETALVLPDERIAEQMAVHARPEMRSARTAVDAAALRKSLSLREHLPALDITSRYDMNRQVDPFTFHTNVWQAGVTASVGLFSGGAVHAAYKGASASLEQARHDHDETAQQVALEVQSAFISLREAAGRIRESRKLLRSAEDTLQLAISQFEAGRGSIFDLTDAQNQALRARLNANDSLADYRVAQANLERAVGAPLADMQPSNR